MSSKAEKGTRRLFFALWPDQATRRAIHQAASDVVREAGGRAVPVENYHLTLAFLGARPASLLPAICEAAARVRPPVGELRLERIGCFARPRVLWLGPTRAPSDLSEFAQALWDQLESLGLARERREFAAHLTLARKARRPREAQIRPVVWHYTGFALIESVTDPHGARYRVIAEWSRACEKNDSVK
jgi:2'-5' RNA ligase